ncbi:MAG: neutral zinc metallopeptidase [Actinomycetota bacterium]
MTKIRSRDSRMIQDRRGSGGSARSGGASGGLGDLLSGGLSGGLGGGGGGGGLGGGLGGALGGALAGGAAGRGCGTKGGGMLIGLLVVAATVFLPQLLGGGSGGGFGLAPSGGAATASELTTGGDDDPCSSEAEQILCGATIDVQEYWIDEYPRLTNGQEYPVTQTVFFSGFTNTGCGQASAQTGPFYCPADRLIYFDLDFLAELQSRFGIEGDLAAQYIVAHEYGHHVQNALGIDANMRRLQQQDPANANRYLIALELQADCLAGAWAIDAEQRNLFDSPDEIQEALNAAEAVGDDRIQMSTQGQINPETWTHGSSEQRLRWFLVGYDTANPANCDTFSDPFNL